MRDKRGDFMFIQRFEARTYPKLRLRAVANIIERQNSNKLGDPAPHIYEVRLVS